MLGGWLPLSSQVRRSTSPLLIPGKAAPASFVGTAPKALKGLVVSPALGTYPARLGYFYAPPISFALPDLQIVGIAYARESADIASAQAEEVTGTAASTLANDAASAAGATGEGGQVAVTLGNDTSSGTGARGATGSISAQLRYDSGAAVGEEVVGIASATLRNDAAAGTGVRGETGAASAVLRNDACAAVGRVTQTIRGTVAAQLRGDVSASTGAALGPVFKNQTTQVTLALDVDASVTAGADAAFAMSDTRSDIAQTKATIITTQGDIDADLQLQDG